jgi:hypothetical protein
MECWCHRCDDVRTAKMTRLERMLTRRFIVCPDCGNKRCPKATDHDLACTKSNEPGQPGSVYE